MERVYAKPSAASRKAPERDALAIFLQKTADWEPSGEHTAAEDAAEAAAEKASAVAAKAPNKAAAEGQAEAKKKAKEAKKARASYKKKKSGEGS